MPDPPGRTHSWLPRVAGGAGRRLRKLCSAPIHPGPLLPTGSCLLPLCLDTARTKICVAWPLSAHIEMLVDFYIAPRHTGGSRWDMRNAGCCVAWCGEAGLANRWIILEWALGLPGNHFSQAGLLEFQEAGFALLCLPMAQLGSVQKEERSPLWPKIPVGVAPFGGSLPGLEQRAAQVPP